MLSRSTHQDPVCSSRSFSPRPITRVSRVAAAVAALVVAYAGPASATVFTSGITGSETGYESVRTVTEDGTVVYDFAAGDRIDLTDSAAESAVHASDGTCLDFNGSVGIRQLRRAPQYIDSAYGLFAEGIGSSIVTDDITIDMSHEAYVGAPITFMSEATGIGASGGSFAARNVSGTIRATADRSAGSGFAMVNALNVANSGRLVVEGDADFSLSASVSEGEAWLTGLSMEGRADGVANHASVGGVLRIAGSAVVDEFDTSGTAFADAVGITVQSDGEALLGRLETDLRVAVDAPAGTAQVAGIDAAATTLGGALVQAGSADIRVSARSSGDGASSAFGVVSDIGAVIRLGESAISVTSVSESSAKAYGLLADAGTIDLTSGSVTITALGVATGATGTATVDGVLADGGTVRIGSGNISAFALAGENATARALVAQAGGTIDYEGGRLSVTSDGWQAVGLYADGGTIRTGSFTAEIGDMEVDGRQTHTPRTVGMWLADNDASVTVEGDAGFTMTTSGSLDLLMSTGVSLGGEPTDEYHSLTVTGTLSVTSSVTPLDDAVSDAWMFSRGIYVDSAADVDIGALRLDLSAAARAPEQYAETTGVESSPENGTAKIRIGDVDIRLSSIGEKGAEAGSYGIYAVGSTDLEIGAGDIRVVASSDGFATAVAIDSEGARIAKGQGTLSAVSDGQAFGIYAAGGGSVTYGGGMIFAESRGTSSAPAVSSAGIAAVEGSSVTLTGSTSMDVRGPEAEAVWLEGSTLTVAGDLTVVSEGSGLFMDSTSTLVVADSGSVTVNSVESYGTARLAAGSSLTVTGESSLEVNTLGSIEATNARINVGAGGYSVKSLTGAGNTLRFTNLADNTGVTFDSAVTDLSLAAAGTANDQFASPEDAARAALEAVNFTDPATMLGATDLVVEEGAVNNALTARVGEDGALTNVRVTENTKLAALGSLTMLGAFQWRHDMSDLARRAGELRDAPQGVGAWVRGYGTNLSYGGVDNTNTSIQVGADTDVGGGWKLGAAFSYTDGSSDLTGGTAESDAYGFALYGTYLKENGAYVDLIAKVSRLESDFTVREMTGSIDNNAWSVNVEAGHRFAFADRAFVEPQVALTYGRVSGDDFMTGNGVRVQQDDFTSLVGRAGARAGFFLPQKKGTLYARFSVLNDFEGELDTLASMGNARNTVHDDIGGTWVEYGVGANFNFTPSTYGYVDLERSSGGDVNEDLRWNAGVRFVF